MFSYLKESSAANWFSRASSTDALAARLATQQEEQNERLDSEQALDLVPRGSEVENSAPRQEPLLAGMRDPSSPTQKEHNLLRQQAAIITVLQKDLATVSGEVQRLAKVIKQQRSEMAKERKFLQTERKKFADDVEEHRSIQELLSTAPNVEGGEVRIKVADEVFTLFQEHVLEKGGFLASVFSGNYFVPYEEDGSYRLRFPFVTRDDFRLVAQYYHDDLPAFIGPEAAARAVQAADRLLLPNMVFEVGKRTVDLAQQSAEMLGKVQRMVDAVTKQYSDQRWEMKSWNTERQGPLLPVGWEPISQRGILVICRTRILNR